MKKLVSKMALAARFALLGLAAPPVSANLGDNLYVLNNGNVVVTFVGTSASYDSHLSVNGSLDFFPNHATTSGTTIDLGPFTAGTLLDVVLHVVNTDKYYHTGPASQNPDQVAHASVTWGPNGSALVGFEDLWGGGDHDYNDHVFSFTNTTPVPEPGTYAMLLAGLGMLGFIVRRRSIESDFSTRG